MPFSRPAPVALTVLAYVAVSFAVQGGSHFVVNADHYAAMAIFRPEPIVPMGILSMVVQGLIFAVLFPVCCADRVTVGRGVTFAWALGAFLASYIALGEAGKYAVPSVSSWIMVEVAVAAVQYTVFGILLGLIHRRGAQPAPAPARS